MKKTKVTKVSWFEANVGGQYIIRGNKVWKVLNILDTKHNDEVISRIEEEFNLSKIAQVRPHTMLDVAIEYVMSVREMKKRLFNRLLTDRLLIEEIVQKNKDFDEVFNDIVVDELVSFNESLKKGKKK